MADMGDYDLKAGASSAEDGGSGELPEDTMLTVSDSGSMMENMTTMFMDPTTTISPALPFELNKYKIGFLAARAVLALLLLVIAAAVKRDCMKTFIFLLLVPIIVDIGWDVYTEVEAGMYPILGRGPETWELYMRDAPVGSVLHQLHSHQLDIYRDMLGHFTTYNLFKQLPMYALVSFAINDFLFWSFLLSTIVLLNFAHRAIVQPEDINYMPTFWPFLRIQSIPVLLTALDVLLNLFTLPPYVFIGVSVVLRLFTIVVSLIIVVLFLKSFFMYCRRPDEYAMGSPYSVIRFAKSRLFWLQIFVFLMHVLSAPYVAWCGISIAQDFTGLFGLGHLDDALLYRTIQAFTWHLEIFFIRAVVLCLFTIVLLPPFRKKFCRIFFPCCCKKE